MRKIYYYIFSIMFLIIILLPFIGMPFYDTNAANENRHLTEFPNFGKQKLRHCIKQLNDYIADHHAFRNELSNQYFRTLLNILNESPIPQKAILGKDGWLYLGDEYNMVYSNALGIKGIDNKKLEEVCDAINKMKECCEGRGIKFYFTIAPNKSTIYPEYLPLVPNTQPKSKDLIKKRLKDSFDIDIIDFEETLIPQKALSILYYKQDSHWNHYGGMLAAQHLLNKIAEDFDISIIHPEDYAIEENNSERSGDLSRMLILKSADFDFDIRRKVPYNIESAKGILTESEDDYLHTKNTTSNNTIKGLFFRDSFLSAMQPFCSEMCSEGIFVSNETGLFDVNVFNEVISSFHTPDFCVFEIVERNLDYISFREEKAK